MPGPVHQRPQAGLPGRNCLGGILAHLGREPTLTAAGLPGLDSPGATIDFRTAADTVGFEIDTGHTGSADLRFSSMRLSLAEAYAGCFGPQASRVRRLPSLSWFRMKSFWRRRKSSLFSNNEFDAPKPKLLSKPE